MEIAEVEEAARQLCRRCANEKGITPDDQPSFSAFHSWLQERHSDRIEFLQRLGVAYKLKAWFDQEFNLQK